MGAFVYGSASALAQREKNYIYLFDCTNSMIKNKLWTPAQNALDNNITLRGSIPGANFVIIPFGDNPYNTFSFDSSKYPKIKKDLAKEFNVDIQKAKYTNISDVLNAGFRQVNPNKANEVYLLTDGEPNGSDSPQKVAQTINKWCASHRNTKLFYVALTQGVVNPVIKQAIDACPDASIVQCQNGIVPVVTDVTGDVYTNLEELEKGVVLTFGVPGNYNLSVSSNDGLFSFSVVGNKASNGKILAKITPMNDLTIDQLHQKLQGEDYEFIATIQCASPGFFIANPDVTVHVADGMPAKLTLAQGIDELETAEAEWYDAFLWSNAAPDKKVAWNLAPVFRNELQCSRLNLRFQTGEGETNDYQAWYNGQPVANGSIITIMPGQPALLEVLFNHDAETGKRYFDLIPVAADGLDIINEQAPDDYEGTSLRTKYIVGWNPLKTFLFCLGIILLSALILWLAVLKRFFYPKIKLGKITMAGPDSYYNSKKIKGARKVVMTSKKRSQNILSRIFTGEVKFIKADHFSPEISIVPAGGKKKVKLRSKGTGADAWDIYPSTIFAQYEKGTIENRASGKKSNIELS